MARHRDVDPRVGDDLLVAEADHARAAAPRPSLVDPVEVDEAHGLAGPVRVRDAGTQPAGDEEQVGISVARLDGALRGVEVDALLEPVVLVAGALREDPAQGVDVRRHALRAEPRDQAPVEEAGRRVQGPVETVRVGSERVVIFDRQARAQLDDVEARPRRQLEGQLERTVSPPRSNGSLSYRSRAVAVSGGPTIAARRQAAINLMAIHDGSSSNQRRLNFGERGKAWWLLCRLSPPVSHARAREL